MKYFIIFLSSGIRERSKRGHQAERGYFLLSIMDVHT